MSFNYSNPFLPAPIPSRSTFSAVGSMPTGSQVLFGGLPLDVTEKDIRELLVNEPLGLAASTTSARSIYTSEGAFTGYAVINVGNETDAERIRREYSGQTIDGTFRLTVQHVLPPTQPLPSAAVVPMVFPAAVPQPPIAPVAPVAPVPARAKPPVTKNKDRAPGLKLLARMGGNGGHAPQNKQLALIAQQKANLGAGRAGAALLSRLARPSSKSNPKSSPKPAPAAKVGRAKQALDTRPKQKTQAELDEEMRAYTRQSRFA